MTEKIRISLQHESNRSSTQHRVSEELVSEYLTKNESNIKENTPDDIRLEKDAGHRNLETELLRQRIERYKKDTELREKYANKVYKFVIGYTIVMFFIVFLSGWKFPTFYIDTVPLTTLIGSSFVSAIGLVHLVVKGLFPTQRDSLEKEHELNLRSD